MSPFRPGISSCISFFSKKHLRQNFPFRNSNISRVLEPSVSMELQLTSGQRPIIHLPMSQFHNLRFQVASALSKLDEIQQPS